MSNIVVRNTDCLENQAGYRITRGRAPEKATAYNRDRRNSFCMIDTPSDFKELEIISDAHLDSSLCNMEKYHRCCKKAVAENRPIVFQGDMFDAMGHTRDPRTWKGELRPELEGAYYSNKMVDFLAEHVAPYKSHIIGFMRGNHESNYEKRQEVDLMAWLAQALGYSPTEAYHLLGGYIQRHAYRVTISKKTRVFYHYLHHGSGGAAPVTKGMINEERKAAALEGYHVYTSGHTHQNLLYTHRKEVITSIGYKYQDVLFMVVPSMLEFGGEWAKEKGFRALATGSATLEFKIDRHIIQGEEQVDLRVNGRINTF